MNAEMNLMDVLTFVTQCGYGSETYSCPAYCKTLYNDGQLIEALIYNERKRQYYCRSRLKFAVKTGNVERAKWLIQHGSPVNQIDIQQDNLILQAVKHNQPLILQELLNEKYGLDVNQVSMVGQQTAIHVACVKGHVACLRVLLADSRVDPNQKCRYESRTPIIFAMLNKNFNCVEELLKDGRADASMEDETGKKVITIAASKNNNEIVRLLLPRATKEDLGDALAQACYYSYTDMAVMLLEAGAPPDYKICADVPVISIVASTLNKPLLLELLKKEEVRSSLNDIDNCGYSVLNWCVRDVCLSKDKAVWHILRNKGAESMKRDNYGPVVTNERMLSYGNGDRIRLGYFTNNRVVWGEERQYLR